MNPIQQFHPEKKTKADWSKRDDKQCSVIKTMYAAEHMSLEKYLLLRQERMMPIL